MAARPLGDQGLAQLAVEFSRLLFGKEEPQLVVLAVTQDVVEMVTFHVVENTQAAGASRSSCGTIQAAGY